MIRTIFRFVGDPVGYVVEGRYPEQLLAISSYWLPAEVGVSGKMVYVDVTKAYYKEEQESDD